MPIATKKHEHNKAERFGQKAPELSPESLNLNGNILFELFSTDLDERLASAGYKKDQEKKVRKRYSHLILSSQAIILEFFGRNVRLCYVCVFWLLWATVASFVRSVRSSLGSEVTKKFELILVLFDFAEILTR